MTKLNRRDFLYTLAASGTALESITQGPGQSEASRSIKPISGSWFEFQHHATVEGVDWNPECVCFSSRQWEEKVKEIADVGMKYLVLMETALYYRAFFPHKDLRAVAAGLRRPDGSGAFGCRQARSQVLCR